MHKPQHAFRRVVASLSWPVRGGVLAVTAGLLALGSLSGVASAATTLTQNTSNVAGFQSAGNGWNYRYVATTATLPNITAAHDPTWSTAIPGGYGASVRLQNGNQTADVAVSTTPGSGVYSAAFALEYKSGKYIACSDSSSKPIPAGDIVRLSLYYNYPDYATSGPNGTIVYGVSDLTTGHSALSFSGTCADIGQLFNTTREVAGFSADDYTAATAPGVTSGSDRLITFTNTVTTSRTGWHGTAGAGPWPVEKLAMVDSTGKVLAFTPYAWDSSLSTFSVWVGQK